MAIATLTQLTATRIAGHELPAALERDWAALAGEIPCRRWEWLEPWWRHYGRHMGELCVLVVRDECNHIVGIAPWYVSRSLIHGRVIRFLGSGDVCSDYLSILTQPECEAAVVDAIADWLSGEGCNQWDLIELIGATADDDAVELLATRMTTRDHLVHQRPGESCWRLALPESWDEYLKSLSKTRRERVRQLIRRNYDTGKARSMVVTDPAELPAAYELLIELHQKRRRSLGEPGCFADPAFTEFHREVIQNFASLSQVQLRYVLFEGRPAAIEYDLLGDRTVYYYQSGLEPELLDQRPGWLGTIQSLRDAIDQGYRTFDFMRGDEAYKASWGAQACRTLETRIVGHRPVAQLRHSAWRAQQDLRRWAKHRLEKLRADSKPASNNSG